MNATALTDFLLAGAALFFAARLTPAWPQRSIWFAGFLLVAAAAAAGGVFHAGMHTAALWKAILVLIGMAIALFIAASVFGGLPHGAARTNWIIAGAIVTAGGFALQQQGSLRWHNVIYHLVQIAGLYLFYRGAQL